MEGVQTQTLGFVDRAAAGQNVNWIIQSLLLADRDWIVLPRLSIDCSQFGSAEITVDFKITTLFPTYLLTSSQIKYKIDNFHGFFAQTDGITFIWIPLCQFEHNKQYENDNF